ncbi:hypothetical protein SE17_09660 [Kouleothrix aurantiaca]|uniref:XRE family transcriptional regulator n=1 Tax=Kouleothrix aurantiaca TaxID=186479 RepID=A0A0P9DCE2_9CHLR|nr:hypothetical protein SE17_09660 [Kouleothrix aurantiaca]
MLRPAENFRDLIARAGLEPKDIIDRAPISRSAYFGWLNPATQPHRRGDLRRSKAWGIARVYAAAAGVTDEDAFKVLFVEVPDDGAARGSEEAS